MQKKEGGFQKAAFLEHRPFSEKAVPLAQTVATFEQAAVPLVFGLFVAATFPSGRWFTTLQTRGQT